MRDRQLLAATEVAALAEGEKLSSESAAMPAAALSLLGAEAS